MDITQLTQKALELRKKYEFYEINQTGKPWSNQEIAQGFVTDVGDLMKIIMAKEGRREMESVDDRLKHELSDCLYCILVLANKYNIDLEKEFINLLEKKL